MKSDADRIDDLINPRVGKVLNWFSDCPDCKGFKITSGSVVEYDCSSLPTVAWFVDMLIRGFKVTVKYDDNLLK